MRIALVFALLLPVQDSGGSMGGGDFGGGSSSSSSDWGGGSSSSDWGSDGGGGGSCSSSDSGSIGWVLWVVIALVILIMIASRLSNVNVREHAPRSMAAMDVSVVTLAIDWRARAAVQKELARLARTADTSTREGRSLLLREAVSSILHAEVSWLYAGASDYTCNLSPQRAEQIFRTAASKAKTRYKKETLRNVEGAKSESTVDSAARPHEGAGVVVITLVVAARRELPDVRNVRDAGRLKTTLRSFAALSPYELAAVEIVWSPAEEQDRMSSAELEMLYPELVKIDPASIAGRVFCKSCAGPYAAELLACPHCGAVES